MKLQNDVDNFAWVGTSTDLSGCLFYFVILDGYVDALFYSYGRVVCMSVRLCGCHTAVLCQNDKSYDHEIFTASSLSESVKLFFRNMRVDLSPRLGDTQWPINPPLLSSSHSPSFPLRNGVRSHSRCGTES